MTNLMDYMDWRGDITLEQDGFNVIDALIMSQLSYVDFENVGPDAGNPVCIKDAVARCLKQYENPDEMLDSQELNEGQKTFIRMRKCDRYRNLKLVFYSQKFSEEKAMQFGAVTILLDDGSVVAAFRGTDGTITGWEEDFNLCYMMPVASQVEADKYLGCVMEKFAGKVYICGHSKGGNLAIYSTFHRSDEQIMRIGRIYSFDGPGFMKEVIESPEYERISPKIESYLPQSSIVGMIMYSGDDYNIVHSDAHGIMQHFVLSWNVIGKEFVPDEKLKDVSVVFISPCRKWIDGISPKERRLFIHIVFRILKAPNAGSFNEYSSNLIKTANSIIKSYGSLDKTTRRMIKRIVAQMIKMSRESISEHIDEKKKPQAGIKGAHGVK